MLRSVRQYLRRPSELFDAAEALIRITHLSTTARDSEHGKAAEYRAILTEFEKRQHSLTADYFHDLTLALRVVQAKVARQVTTLSKIRPKHHTYGLHVQCIPAHQDSGSGSSASVGLHSHFSGLYIAIVTVVANWDIFARNCPRQTSYPPYSTRR